MMPPRNIAGGYSLFAVPGLPRRRSPPGRGLVPAEVPDRWGGWQLPPSGETKHEALIREVFHDDDPIGSSSKDADSDEPVLRQQNVAAVGLARHQRVVRGPRVGGVGEVLADDTHSHAQPEHSVTRRAP